MAVESNMRLYSNISPADVGVASKLFPRDPSVLHGSYPYETAVQELKLLCRDYCPQKKLDCIGKPKQNFWFVIAVFCVLP